MNDGFTLPAFAKINLFLHILGKRDDGYHELCTVFQSISLHDSLSFSSRTDDRIILTCDDPGIPVDENNLIVCAASMLKQAAGSASGANIHLEKRIPSPGGLGGGSSDAAVALIGLIRLWQLNIENALLNDIAEQLGADVPFFLRGGTALGTGRGTDLTRTTDYSAPYMIVITPPVNVATARAYSLLSARSLTNEVSKSSLIVCHNEAQKLISEQTDLRNDFEDVVFKAEPELARTKNFLLALNPRQVLMCGSGASFFAVFDDEAARQYALEHIAEEKDWQIFSVETVSRAAYAKALGIGN